MSYPSYPPSDQPPPPGGGYGYGAAFPREHESNQLALWSMIVAIVSLPANCFCGIGLFGGIAAMVMGFIANRQIEASQGWQTGGNQAIAGMIVGGLAILFGAISIIMMFLSFTLGDF